MNDTRLTSILKRSSMQLFLLISLIITLTIFTIDSVNAAPSIIAEANGQLNICNQPNPCFIATFQANVSGPDDADLLGMLLIYGAAPSSPQPCMATVTGSLDSRNSVDNPSATLIGTLGPADPANATCVGGLQEVSVTLFVDGILGTARLTTLSSVDTELLGSGSGTLIVEQP